MGGISESKRGMVLLRSSTTPRARSCSNSSRTWLENAAMRTGRERYECQHHHLVRARRKQSRGRFEAEEVALAGSVGSTRLLALHQQLLGMPGIVRVLSAEERGKKAKKKPPKR